jgi:hypothetical protein
MTCSLETINNLFNQIMVFLGSMFIGGVLILDVDVLFIGALISVPLLTLLTDALRAAIYAYVDCKKASGCKCSDTMLKISIWVLYLIAGLIEATALFSIVSGIESKTVIVGMVLGLMGDVFFAKNQQVKYTICCGRIKMVPVE